MNHPYVKQYDENGVLKNPIKGIYAPTEANRRERRRNEPRFMNNRKTSHLLVVGTRKFNLVLQRLKEGVVKHYLEK